jgi:hypothetical protein
MIASADLFPVGAHDRVAGVLRSGPLILAAGAGAGESAFLDELIDRPTVRVDARRWASDASVVLDLVSAVLARIAPTTQVGIGASALRTHERLAIATAYHDVNLAVNVAMGANEPEMTLERSLGAIPDDTVLVVEHAHRVWDKRLLWTLRGHAEEGRALTLTTRPWAERALVDRRAAFFGFAQTVELDATVNINDLARGHDAMQPREIEWALERTQRLRGPMRELMAAAEFTGSLDTAWDLLVDTRSWQLDQLMTSAQALTRWGARLLEAVARGNAPYAAAADAQPARIAHALKTLREADLIYQPTRRQWKCTDPFLAAAIKRRPRHLAER